MEGVGVDCGRMDSYFDDTSGLVSLVLRTIGDLYLSTSVDYFGVSASLLLKAALIGFGADASHGYERTHTDALQATAQLVAAYLLGTPE